MLFFENHFFLVFCFLCFIPLFIILLLRRDLWPLAWRAGLLSLPFAFTEWLFYPTYWQPIFLFDLIKYLGFGIEDILFVLAIGSVSAIVYPCLAHQSLQSELSKSGGKLSLPRALIILGGAALGLWIGQWAKVLIIWLTIGLMLIIPSLILIHQPNRWRAGIWGALGFGTIYAVLCWVLQVVYPGIFLKVWRTEHLSNFFILHVPGVEILYGIGCGWAAGIVIPYLLQWQFISRAEYTREERHG